MSKQEKLVQRLLSRPKDFTFDELATLLTGLGYSVDNRGKSSGSAVRFIRVDNMSVISIHKPHPQNTLKMYVINLVIDELTKRGILK